MVLADPAEPRLNSPVTLQHGCRVDKGPVLRDACTSSELSQFALHDVMIILTKGIVGNLRLAFRQSMSRIIIERYDDDGLHTGHEEARVEPFVEVVLEIVHIGVAALGEPFRVMIAHSISHSAGTGKATNKKAEVLSLGFNHIT